MDGIYPAKQDERLHEGKNNPCGLVKCETCGECMEEELYWKHRGGCEEAFKKN